MKLYHINTVAENKRRYNQVSVPAQNNVYCLHFLLHGKSFWKSRFTANNKRVPCKFTLT